MKSIRTLIVDDDEDLLQVANSFLKSIESAFDITTASSARKALAFLKQDTFDAIISDYQMPDINGIEFLIKVRKSNPDIPFIIFTGKGREEIAIQALNLGATHYVTKIVDPKTQYTELAHIVKKSVEHAQASQALIESEERYRIVFDNAMEGIVLVRLEDKRITSANNSFCEMLGYSHDELLELGVSDLHPADQLAEVIKAFNAQTDGTEKLAGEIPMLCKNGRIFYADVTAVVVRLNGIDYQLGIFRDISSRLEGEKAQQESDELYRMIAEGSSDVLFITDMDMKRKYLSPSTYQLRGYTREESLAQSLDELYPPDSLEIILKAHSTALYKIKTEGKLVEPWKFECQMYRKDGSTVWVETSASAIYDERDNPIGIVGITRDISVRKATEEALQEREESYRMLYENIPDGVVRFDLEGNVVMYNKQTLEMFGYSEEEGVGLHFTHFLPDSLKLDAKALFSHIIAQGKRPLPRTPFIGLTLRKDGSTFYAHVTSNIIRVDREVVGLLSFVRDITNLRELEETLKKQKDELSKFAHHMSHDLRSYIHGIVGYAGLIQEVGGTEYSAEIINLAKKTETLLARSIVLADAGDVIGEKTEVSLKNLITEITSATISNDVKVKIGNLPFIMCDREKTGQIFRNLILNAIEHAEAKTISFLATKLSEGVEILISNDGTPISKKNKQRIFDSGFTTKSDGGGLGLNIIKRIVEAHSWQISLEPDEQTTFKLFIPSKDIRK